MHFWFLNYEKQYKEGICKVLGRSVVFQHFMQIFLSLSQISDYHHLKRSRGEVHPLSAAFAVI